MNSPAISIPGGPANRVKPTVVLAASTSAPSQCSRCLASRSCRPSWPPDLGSTRAAPLRARRVPSRRAPTSLPPSRSKAPAAPSSRPSAASAGADAPSATSPRPPPRRPTREGWLAWRAGEEGGPRPYEDDGRRGGRPRALGDGWRRLLSAAAARGASRHCTWPPAARRGAQRGRREGKGRGGGGGEEESREGEGGGGEESEGARPRVGNGGRGSMQKWLEGEFAKMTVYRISSSLCRNKY